jgi:hypothetical protein
MEQTAKSIEQGAAAFASWLPHARWSKQPRAKSPRVKRYKLLVIGYRSQA